MRPMGCFERVAPVVDFPDAESRIRDFWREHDVFARSLEARKASLRQSHTYLRQFIPRRD